MREGSDQPRLRVGCSHSLTSLYEVRPRRGARKAVEDRWRACTAASDAHTRTSFSAR